MAERVGRAFEAKYPGIAVRVERSGGERIFQRIGQEYASKIHAVDVVNSSDAAHFIVWKRDGLLAPYVPEDVAEHYPAEHKDPDGLYASWRIWLCVIGYNTKLVTREEAPKSFADLLDPKWIGKIVKAHPGYSGTIMTATFQIARDIGWEYFEKLARQRVMQVQSSADPPKTPGGGRARHHGGRQRIQPGAAQRARRGGRGRVSDRGHAADRRPVRGDEGCAQPQRGTPAAELHVLPRVPAADGRLRRAALLPRASSRKSPAAGPLNTIKLMKDDPVAVEQQADEIKARYTPSIFKV